MTPRVQSSITEMLNVFNQTSRDYEVFLVTLGRLCAGLTDQAIIEAAERFAAGDVKDQSKTFAPSGPEFVEEARRRQEFIDLRNRPRLPKPAPRFTDGPAPFQVRLAQARASHAHRPILVEDVTLEQWRNLSRNRQVPAGAVYVACLATVYGPEPKHQIELAAE